MVAGALILLFGMIIGTILNGRMATRDTENAVRSVSLFYLNELAGRREQVVASNLQSSINNVNVAISIMDRDDRSDLGHLQAYEASMKMLYGLELFAFVDEDGMVYTTYGIRDMIGEYDFDYRNLTEPHISVRNLETNEKRAVIAVPVQGVTFMHKKLPVCLVEINMNRLLEGVSIQTENNNTTFCNIYTRDGYALSNIVLGGLTSEVNLLEALKNASFEEGYAYETMKEQFRSGQEGVSSFTYNEIQETIYYVPVGNTDWMLTYLIRESVITERIGTVTQGILRRSIMQTGIISVTLLALFGMIIAQSRKNAALAIEKEKSDAENRVKQQKLEHRLELQEKVLEQEKLRAEQRSLITALSSDYRSVYYIDLDNNEGVCYQPHTELEEGLKAGEHFPFRKYFNEYAEAYVRPEYREEFLRFVDPESIREQLSKERVISFRYITTHHSRESYEMIRFAGVREAEDAAAHRIQIVGACFADIDAETRKTLQESQTLADALAAAEEANQAKTAFLSNMSHEIRTPMNAIIGLDNIALNDPDTSEKTREYLEKIGTSARHLLGIINDILDMSRIESGRMSVKSEEFSFSKALEEVNTIISGQCRDKGLQYECRLIGNVDDYYIGDDMKLRQVMINILGNAVKFTPEGGKVTFSVEETARYDGKSALRFVISDTGIGMSKEFLPKVFDAFAQEDSSRTNKYSSTGLGMPITKSIVELMNGTIDVESEKGVGTTFTVCVTLGETDRKQSEETLDELDPKKICALVIDDDPVACEHAQLILGQVGIHCETAESGAKAISMVQLRHVRRAPYNLILVDWKMPEMDGIETTRKIREIVGNDTPIIILTSYSWDDILDEATEAGVDSFVAKPLFASSVLDEFKTAFHKKNIPGTGHKADLKGRRVLLAEDMQVNAEIMVMVLGMREMQADIAENGRIAVEKFSEHPAGYYDAILMDMRMPEMDGLEATEAIRALDREDAKRIPIIALTANAFDEDVQRSMQAGLNAHLSKPVEPENLFATLENLIPVNC